MDDLLETLGLIVVFGETDPFFKDVVSELLMRAKLRYEDLGSLVSLTDEVILKWEEIRNIEDECMNDGSISKMDAYKISNERTYLLQEDHRELQGKVRQIKRKINEEIHRHHAG